MKKLIYILSIASLLMACEPEEDPVFNVDLTDLQVSFEPYNGGATMTYTLPANTDIYGIQARYLDFNGDPILVKGTHTNNKLDLFGFNQPEESVPVEISLIDQNGYLSETLDYTFSTLPSLAVSIFNDLEVTTHWNGFRVTYPEIEGRTQGYINIYYVGTNPKTNLIDSLLVSSQPFNADGKTFRYTDIEDTTLQDVTVVVKTEDARWNSVGKKVYENIPISRAGKFNSSDIGFSGSSVEDEIKKLGWKYLFDGDERGLQCLKNGDHSKFYSYKSEKEAEFDGNNVLTLDLQEVNEIAWIRIYSIISAKIPNEYGQYLPMKLTHQYFYPNHVTLYGANNADDPEEAWTELSYYYESARIERESRWTYPGYDSEAFYTVEELDLFIAEDPNYIQLDCDITGIPYRFLKVKINETFYYRTSGYEIGLTGEFTMEELEVYVKKEGE